MPLSAKLWMLGSLLTSVLGARQADPGKQIQAQYDRWSKAYMARDVDTLLGILTPDYKLTTVDKDVMTYATYKAYLQLKKKAPRDATRYSTRIKAVKLAGNTAIVDCVETMATHQPGQASVSIHQHTYKDTWKLIGNTWRLQSTVTLKENTTGRVKG